MTAFCSSQKKKDLTVRSSIMRLRTGGPNSTTNIMEDNALNAEIAIELLESIGLTVDWAENGKIGLEQYEQSQIGEYFAVFMDMKMPVMDGVTATKAIRSSEREDNHILIFAMTANTFASDRRVCREAGMNGYIPKPISIQAIQGTLEAQEKADKEV